MLVLPEKSWWKQLKLYTIFTYLQAASGTMGGGREGRAGKTTPPTTKNNIGKNFIELFEIQLN